MSAPLFPEFYDTIKSVLSREEQYIIGHTTEADCKYMRSECQRYDLPLINCRYYDIRAPFKILQNEEQFSKLEKMYLITKSVNPSDCQFAKGARIGIA